MQYTNDIHAVRPFEVENQIGKAFKDRKAQPRDIQQFGISRRAGFGEMLDTLQAGIDFPHEIDSKRGARNIQIVIERLNDILLCKRALYCTLHAPDEGFARCSRSSRNSPHGLPGGEFRPAAMSARI